MFFHFSTNNIVSRRAKEQNTLEHHFQYENPDISCGPNEKHYTISIFQLKKFWNLVDKSLHNFLSRKTKSICYIHNRSSSDVRTKNQNPMRINTFDTHICTKTKSCSCVCWCTCRLRSVCLFMSVEFVVAVVCLWCAVFWMFCVFCGFVACARRARRVCVCVGVCSKITEISCGSQEENNVQFSFAPQIQTFSIVST